MYNINNIDLYKKYDKAQVMKGKESDNETIRRQTEWFQDKNGDWKFEFTDKYMKIKENLKLQKNTSYKLGKILEHDALFIAYPKLANYEVKFRELKGNNSSFNPNKNIISLNNKLIDSNKSIEGLLYMKYSTQFKI